MSACRVVETDEFARWCRRCGCAGCAARQRDGVRVIGIDEHCWRHTRRGDKYVTVIIDPTPIRDGTGPARLLDMVEGRPKQACKTWLGERDTSWRDGTEVVAMDGFTGSRPPPTRSCRVQQTTCGHRSRIGSMYRICPRCIKSLDRTSTP